MSLPYTPLEVSRRKSLHRNQQSLDDRILLLKDEVQACYDLKAVIAAELSALKNAVGARTAAENTILRAARAEHERAARAALAKIPRATGPVQVWANKA